jgi:hypothetical protein
MRILRLNGPAPHGVCSSAIHLDAVIPDEAKLTSGVLTRPGRSCKFFTDITLCIGCKACEVACKEWNNLQAETLVLTGDSLTTLAPFPRCVSPNQADGGDKSWTVLRLPAWRSSLPPSSSDHAQQRASVRSVPGSAVRPLHRCRTVISPCIDNIAACRGGCPGRFAAHADRRDTGRRQPAERPDVSMRFAQPDNLRDR